MDERHLAGVICPIQRFFDSGIAATDHENLFIPVEKAVARSAGRNAETLESCFAGQTEPAGLGARRNDHRVCGEFRAAIGFQMKRAAGEIHLRNMIGDDLGTDMKAPGRASAPISQGPWMTSAKPG